MLRILGLEKSFGALKALDSVTLTIEKGEIHGIMGPNGSGKTTLFDCVTGLLKPDAGSISLMGEEIAGLKPHAIAGRGIRRTFQSGRIVPEMTVRENVMTGVKGGTRLSLADALLRPPFSASRMEAETAERAMRALRFVGMESSAERWADSLSWVERQLIQIARALVSEPKLLLLDEPASGMGKGEIERVRGIVSETRRRGVTIAFVSHDVRMLMELSDRVTVLNYGRNIAQGTPGEVRRDPRVLEAYLGDE